MLLWSRGRGALLTFWRGLGGYVCYIHRAFLWGGVLCAHLLQCVNDVSTRLARGDSTRALRLSTPFIPNVLLFNVT